MLTLRLVPLALVLAPVAAAQKPLFNIPGDGPGDGLGAGMAALGDVDGDGAADFAISGWSGGDRVRVYSGATQQPLYTLSNGVNDQFGRSIASLGDIDGDGLDDLVIGALNQAAVYSGTGAPLYTVFGAAWFDVGGGGDADGDGVGDFLVAGNGLKVYSGATGGLIRSHVSPATGCTPLESSPTFFGDVNGDGHDEYAVGAPGQYGCSSKSWVFAYDGATGALLWSHSGAGNDQMGWAMDALADVTGDGNGELLVSAKQDGGVGCGCSGKGYLQLLDGVSGAVLWTVLGTGTYIGLGYDVAVLGDINGNGYEDFAAGQPGSEFGCDAFAFPVQVRDGLTGNLIFELPWSGQGFGQELASGDVNGDGLRDLLVAAPCDDTVGLNAGLVFAYQVEPEAQTYCVSKLNTQGCAPSMTWTGTPSLAASNFRARAHDVLNNKNGLLFWGRAPAAIPFQGGSLCIGGTIIRTPLQSSAGNPPPDDCSGTYTYQFTSGYMAAANMQMGETIYCQYWYRDPADAFGSGLSNGLAFQVLP